MQKDWQSSRKTDRLGKKDGQSSRKTQRLGKKDCQSSRKTGRLDIKIGSQEERLTGYATRIGS